MSACKRVSDGSQETLLLLQLRGYGSSADAHHITQPPEDGRGAVLAMQRALESAGAAPSQVTYINAHGTATPLGDVAELRAIQGVFGSSGPAQDPAQQYHTVRSCSVACRNAPVHQADATSAHMILPIAAAHARPPITLQVLATRAAEGSDSWHIAG